MVAHRFPRSVRRPPGRNPGAGRRPGGRALLENPSQPQSASDERTDQWTTTYGAGGIGLILFAERDRAALRPLPELPYLVPDKYLRRVGKDCLISFDASLYSLPARRVRAGQTVEVRAGAGLITIHALTAAHGGGPTLLAAHPRAVTRPAG